MNTTRATLLRRAALLLLGCVLPGCPPLAPIGPPPRPGARPPECVITRSTDMVRVELPFERKESDPSSARGRRVQIRLDGNEVVEGETPAMDMDRTTHTVTLWVDGRMAQQCTVEVDNASRLEILAPKPSPREAVAFDNQPPSLNPIIIVVPVKVKQPEWNAAPDMPSK